MNELSPEDVAKKAERDKADREKIEAFGYDAGNPAVLSHYQDLQSKFEKDRITQQDLLRGMEKQAFEIADKERREALKNERANELAREQPTVERDATAERMAGRGEKEAEGVKVDLSRMRSDPDYRREVKERSAEQSKEERQQRAGQSHDLERDDRQR